MLILLHIDYSLHLAMACLSSCLKTMACKAENIYRHALFYCASLYCISYIWVVNWRCVAVLRGASRLVPFFCSIYSLEFHILVILATFLTFSNKLYLLWSVISDLCCYHWTRIKAFSLKAQRLISIFLAIKFLN